MIQRIGLIAIVFVLLNFSAIAQNEKPFSIALSSQLENFYNAGAYDSIFYHLTADMQNLLPQKDNSTFFTNLKKSKGKIVKREFLKYENGAALYKVSFEKGTMELILSGNKEKKITGFQFKPETAAEKALLEKNITALTLPFKGTWDVFWGGDTEVENYHVVSKPQKNAFDFVIRDEKGKSFKGSGVSNEDYYAFGKEILAPCEGTIVAAIDGIYDNKPGEMNPYYTPGNCVILKTANNEYLFFGHFKQNTIKVKLGQKVSKEQVLGLCGNSGNSSEAHLHFHIQDREDINKAIGVKCYFESVIVNGEKKSLYSPLKNEKISAK